MTETTQAEVLDIAHRLRRQTTNMQMLTLCDWVIHNTVSMDVSTPVSADAAVAGCKVCAARKAKDAQRKSTKRGKA